jgi:HSP20 family protein
MKQTLTKPETRTAKEETARTHFLTPLANIVETKDGYVLEAEMPGVTKDGLEITVDNGELLILGHRNAAPKSGQVLYQESRDLSFRRVFELDPSIDASKIHAKIDQGVLRLTLPKAESVKPRKISVGE